MRGSRLPWALSFDLRSTFDLVISGQPLYKHGLNDTPMITLSPDDSPNDTWQLKFPFRPSELLDLAHQRLALAQAHPQAMCIV